MITNIDNNEIGVFANAEQIQGTPVDKTNIANGKVLAYNSTTDKLEYVEQSSGGTTTSPVTSVNSKIGAVVLTKSDIGLSAVENVTSYSTTVTDTLLSNKVDKVDGKTLSTNDYTSTDKLKVDKINISGNGSTFLANDGTYKSVVTETNWGNITGTLSNQTDLQVALEGKQNILPSTPLKPSTKYLNGNLEWTEISTPPVTQEERDRFALIVNNGLGDKFLSDDGTYKSIGTGSGSVTSVNGKDGIVVLTKDNIGLSNVLNIESYSKVETNNLLDTKVDKVVGKGLSTNDFTNTYKSKLDNVIDLTNNGDTSLHYHSTDRDRTNHTGSQAISTVTGLQTALDNKQATLVSGNNIKTINGGSVLGSGDIVISSPITSVNSKTGAVVLTCDDISNGTNYVQTENNYNAIDKGKVNVITKTGDGNSYLANNGTYKTVSSGSSVTVSYLPFDYTYMLTNKVGAITSVDSSPSGLRSNTFRAMDFGGGTIRFNGMFRIGLTPTTTVASGGDLLKIDIPLPSTTYAYLNSETFNTSYNKGTVMDMTNSIIQGQCIVFYNSTTSKWLLRCTMQVPKAFATKTYSSIFIDSSPYIYFDLTYYRGD